MEKKNPEWMSLLLTVLLGAGAFWGNYKVMDYRVSQAANDASAAAAAQKEVNEIKFKQIEEIRIKAEQQTIALAVFRQDIDGGQFSALKLDVVRLEEQTAYLRDRVRQIEQKDRP
jgi:hypothetical protein